MSNNAPVPEAPSLLFLYASRQFNRQEFWECHETLEMLWLRAESPLKTFLQGIIQIAAGCHHIENNNAKGAISLLSQGINKLHHVENVSALHDWINLKDFIEGVESTIEEVNRLGSIRIQQFCPGKYPEWISPEPPETTDSEKPASESGT